MKKYILSVVICFVGVFGIFSIITDYKEMPYVKTENLPKYVVMEYRGKIGVFSGDNKKPNKIISVSVASLPPKDRLDLSNGIKIKNDKELLKFIEDFDGDF